MYLLLYNLFKKHYVTYFSFVFPIHPIIITVFIHKMSKTYTFTLKLVCAPYLFNYNLVESTKYYLFTCHWNYNCCQTWSFDLGILNCTCPRRLLTKDNLGSYLTKRMMIDQAAFCGVMPMIGMVHIVPLMSASSLQMIISPCAC